MHTPLRLLQCIFSVSDEIVLSYTEKAKMAKKTKTSASPKTPSKVKKSTSQGDTPVASPASKKLKKAKAPAPSQAKEFGYVSKSQAQKAVSELQKYLARQKEQSEEKSQLFDDEDEPERDLYVDVQTKKYISQKPEFKPRLIELAKPYLREQEELKTCLFLRDHFISNAEQLEEVENADIPTLKKILTLTQLKTIYHTFEKRRELYSEYDLFLVDEAILSSMPNVLGKTFYMNEKAKFPINIRVASTKNQNQLSLVTLNNQLNKVLSSTAYLPPVGNSVLIKIGSFNKLFSETDLLENLHNVLKTFDESLLLTIGIKTTESPVVPLYYTDKIYSDSDVLENAPEEDGEEEEETEDFYTKALLELADEETVNKALGAELRKKKKSKKITKGISKK